MNNPELGPRLILKNAELTKILEEKEGKAGELLFERLNKIQDWLLDIKPAFSEYARARDEAKKMERRTPQSTETISLNLDSHAGRGELLHEYENKKRTFYEAIRSSRSRKKTGPRLALDDDERTRLLKQLNDLTNILHIGNPNFEALLFPDESFSVSEADLKNPFKEINYPFLIYWTTINQILVNVDIYLRDKKKRDS